MTEVVYRNPRPLQPPAQTADTSVDALAHGRRSRRSPGGRFTAQRVARGRMADDTRREPSADPPSASAARHATPVSEGQTARAGDRATRVAVVDRLPIGVVVYGAKDQVVSVNAAARRLLHLDDAARNGRLLPRPWPGRPTTRAALSWIRRRGRCPRQTNPPGGETAPVPRAPPGAPHRAVALRRGRAPSVWPRGGRWSHGRARDVVVTLLDHTALKAAQDELGTVVAEPRREPGRHRAGHVRVRGARRPVTDVAGAPPAGTFGRRLARRRSDRQSGSWELFEGAAVEKARQAVSLARADGQAGHHRDCHVTLDGGPAARRPVTYRSPTAACSSPCGTSPRKRREEALQHSEAKYRTLYAHTPVMLHSIDAEGRLLSVSDRWLERLGYSASEVLGRRSTAFLHRGVRPPGSPREVVLRRSFASGASGTSPTRWSPRTARSSTCCRQRPTRGTAGNSSARSSRRRHRSSARPQRRTCRRATGAADPARSTVPGFAYRCSNDRDWTSKRSAGVAASS